MKTFTSDESKDKILNFYDTLLEQISVKYEKLNIQNRFGDTFCIASGEVSAPPIILLHSAYTNAAVWIEEISNFSKSYRVYALDLPGGPGKSTDEKLSFDTDDYIDWLSDIFNFLDIQKSILIGASLGAFIATKFSINYPEKVSKLILISPLGIVSNNKIIDLAISVFPKVEEGINIILQFINAGIPIPEVILNYQNYIQARVNKRKDEIPLFKDDELEKLNMPCALFLGENDENINVEETKDKFKALVKDSEVIMLKDKDHGLTGISKEMLNYLQKS